MSWALHKPVTLAYQAAVSLFWDRVTDRREFAWRTISAVRANYFHSRSRIRNISLTEFCARASGAAPDTLKLPPSFVEDNGGIGNPEYFLALAMITRAIQPHQIVEFGTFLGVSALTFALNAPSAKILTIDLPDAGNDISHLNSIDRAAVGWSRQRVGRAYKGTPYEKQISEVRCDSRDLKLTQFVGSAHLVLVDGGHDEQCIRADTDNALAVAQSGTVIIWDDYFWLFPDVVKYLDNLACDRELVCILGTNLVVHTCGR